MILGGRCSFGSVRAWCLLMRRRSDGPEPDAASSATVLSTPVRYGPPSHNSRFGRGGCGCTLMVGHGPRHRVKMVDGNASASMGFQARCPVRRAWKRSARARRNRVRGVALPGAGTGNRATVARSAHYVQHNSGPYSGQDSSLTRGGILASKRARPRKLASAPRIRFRQVGRHPSKLPTGL